MALATAPNAAAQQQLPTIPFRKATLKKWTLLPSYNVGAALGGKNSWELDSKGYLGRVRLLVNGSEVSTADPVANADYPWKVFNRINLRDTSGGMLRNHSGYSGYIAQRFFQPHFGPDLAISADARIYNVAISAVATNPQAFALDLDIECGTRDNLGLVPNQNASFKYSLDVDFEQEANVVTTPANSTFALVAQPSYMYYAVPGPQRSDGAPQASVPPFAGVIRQVFDETQPIPSAAENRYKINTGRVIRNLAFVVRTAAGARLAGGISRIKCLYGDDTILFDKTEQDLITEHYQTFRDVPPAGVYVVSFTQDSDSFNGADFRRDILDTRRLAQMYFLITTIATGTTIDIIHDELIVPSQLSL